MQAPEGGSPRNCVPQHHIGTPDRTRTCNRWIRSPLLYPLSYGGIGQKVLGWWEERLPALLGHRDPLELPGRGYRASAAKPQRGGRVRGKSKSGRSKPLAYQGRQIRNLISSESTSISSIWRSESAIRCRRPTMSSAFCRSMPTSAGPVSRLFFFVYSK